MVARRINRRQVIAGAAAGVALAGASRIVRPGFAADKVIKIGFLAPLTGEVAAWGLPGLYGCEIWAEQVNAKGGVNIGGEGHRIELFSWDDEYLPDKALQGAKKLILEDGVKFIMMLGGDPVPAVTPFTNQHEMLLSTLAPIDLSPDTPYLIAPVEVHPIYNVTGVDWVAINHPELKTAALCAQDDAIGYPSVATYRAAFEVAGIDLVYDNFFSVSTTDFAPIVTAMLAAKPDIVCLDTAYPDFVNLLTEQLFLQGFHGKVVTCTLDNYQQIIDKTSEEFMEGFVFQFPDFDDPAMTRPGINFNDPAGFYAAYVERYPGAWSAVSWEYAAIMEMWKASAEKAGSAEPAQVLAAMKEGGKGQHVFGPATWWGKELFGVDNALVGDWPVVVIRNGKATIAEFRSIPAWWDKNKDVLLRHMGELGQLWNQRT